MEKTPSNKTAALTNSISALKNYKYGHLGGWHIKSNHYERFTN